MLSCKSLGKASIVLVLLAAAGTVAAETAPADSMLIPGGEAGAVFDDMTVEGEDRIQIEFDRPSLALNLDPMDAPGLDWETTLAVLRRNGPDLFQALLDRSAYQRSPYGAKPWFRDFGHGAVARFHPQMKDVDRWSLVVGDSRGRTVVSFQGEGKVPEEIVWDGRGTDGQPAPPGFTYSYVFEAFDRAGNKRNFVGQGFELSPYRLVTEENLVLMLSATHLEERAPAAGVSPLLVEAAGWINQSSGWERPIQITVTARNYETAQVLGEQVARDLGPLVLGDPVRIATRAHVEPDAPAGGTVAIVLGE